MVNSVKVNIASFHVSPGDLVALTPKGSKQLRVKAALELSKHRGDVPWIEVDEVKSEATFVRNPDRSELPAEINEQLIVELYSK